MEAFTATLGQMLELFLFMLVGFILKRGKLFGDEFAGNIARLETLILMPAMIIDTFAAHCTLPNLAGNLDLLLYGIAYFAVMPFLVTPVSRLFSKDTLERNCYKYSLLIPNTGYVGNAVVLGVLGSETLFRYMVFCIPASFFCYSVGVLWLTQTEGRKITWRSFLNPIFISVLIGMALGLTRLPLPKFLSTAISSASACMAPLAMIVTGFIIAQYDLKKLFAAKKIYILSACRLLVIPLLFYAGLRLCGVGRDVLIIWMAFLAMPLGLNTILLPASSGGDTTAGASMALISNLLAIVTIPLIFMLAL